VAYWCQLSLVVVLWVRRSVSSLATTMDFGKNARLDWDAIWDGDLGGLKESCIRWVSRSTLKVAIKMNMVAVLLGKNLNISNLIIIWNWLKKIRCVIQNWRWSNCVDCVGSNIHRHVLQCSLWQVRNSSALWLLSVVGAQLAASQATHLRGDSSLWSRCH